MSDLVLDDSEERYVAFIDILGFSNLVCKAESDPERLRRIINIVRNMDIFNGMAQFMDSLPGDIAGDYKRMTRVSVFSDNIVISTKAVGFGLTLNFVLCSILCNRLMHLGVLIRGGITKGLLVHNSKVVVGSGLIKAYLIESKVAVYPRVVIDDLVLDDARKIKGVVEGFLARDFDGLYYLHVLSTTFATLEPEEGVSYMFSLRKLLAANVVSKDLSIRAKNRWMAIYFNRCAADYNLEEIDF